MHFSRRGGAPSARPPLLPGHRGSFLSRRDGGLGAAAPAQGGASSAVLFGAGLMATFPFWCLTASSSWGFSLRGSVSSSPRSSLLHASFLQSEAVGLTRSSAGPSSTSGGTLPRAARAGPRPPSGTSPAGPRGALEEDEDEEVGTCASDESRWICLGQAARAKPARR